MMKLYLCGAAALLVAPAAIAQSVPAAVAPAATPAMPVDPARLAAARALIDTIMPPSTRDAMLDNMVRPMLARMQQAFTDNPQFTDEFSSDPQARALFQQYMQRVADRTLNDVRPAMPELWDIMARAYARRFTVAQLQEIRAFFETPTGQVYMHQALTVMSDPEVGAWQQNLMRRSMSHLQDDMAQLTRQLTERAEHRP